MLWKQGVKLEVVFSNKNVVASLVYSDPPDQLWMLLNTYGPHSQVGKEHFWEMASNMENSFSGSRMAVGDFNSISNIGEILCLIREQSTWGSMVIYSHGQIEEMV